MAFTARSPTTMVRLPVSPPSTGDGPSYAGSRWTWRVPTNEGERAACYNAIGVTPSTTTAYATPSSTSTSNGPVDWGKRRDEPRVGFVHAMRGCQTHAFPRDKLLAVSGSFSDKYVFCDVFSFSLPSFCILSSSFNGWIPPFPSHQPTYPTQIDSTDGALRFATPSIRST